MTHSRFKVVEALRIIEWEDGQKDRNFRTFHTVDGKYPPDPDLIPEFIDSLKIMYSLGIKDYLKKAMKYFRYGLLDENHEDQHIRFWLALEIIAENVKQIDQIHISCPRCGGPLDCATCGLSPMRIPMAKQAIEDIFKCIVGDTWYETSKRQFDARNTILHGGSIASIEAKTKTSMVDLVNELGAVTWHAIIKNISIPEGETLNLGHWDWNFASKNMIGSMLGKFEHDSDQPHPTDDRIPSVKMAMHTRFEKNS